MKFTKTMAAFLALFLTLSCLPIPARAYTSVNSGTCGDGLTWTLDGNGTLTISGTGPMEDYWSWELTPWFSQRSNITHVIIGNGVSGIGGLAFNQCSNLTSIDLPDSLTSIGSEAFYGCSSLTEIDLPDCLTSIGRGAFYGCSSLTGINLPDGITHIGIYTFEGCSSLTGIDLPDGLTSIGNDAFRSCSSLTEIAIPAGVTHISTGAFSGCRNLKEIYFLGSAPFDGSVEYDIFRDVTATCYYPKNNPTWTADVMQNYGGDLTWYSFGTPDVLPGDINGDSSVDSIDAYRIMLHYSERTELDDIQLAAADVNGDGRVDTADAYLVILCHNGQISTFSAVN